LSNADPVRPIDCVTPACVPARVGEQRTGVFTTLVGVEQHPGHRPAAHRDRHAQRRPRQIRVMMLTEGEPDAPPGMQVQHRREVENPFTGGDLGQIAAPPHVRPLRLAEVPTERVGRLARRSVPLGGGPAGVFRPGHQMLLGHHRRDGVLTDPPPQIPQVRGDPG
jgi:hypothetical protein